MASGCGRRGQEVATPLWIGKRLYTAFYRLQTGQESHGPRTIFPLAVTELYVRMRVIVRIEVELSNM